MLALVAALALAVGGVAWELVRFGPSATSAAWNLEAEVRARLTASASHLRESAARVASQTALIEAASRDRDRVPELFAALPAAPDTALTVYVPAGAGALRVLAWNDGPAEDIPEPRAQADVPTIFVAQGTLGLRLVAWHPIVVDRRRLAVVTAELILSTTAGIHPSLGEYHFPTSFGPVLVTRAGTEPRATDDAQDEKVTVLAEGDVALLDIAFSRQALDTARAQFRRHVLLVSALPLVGLLLVLAAHIFPGRRGSLAPSSFLVLAAGTLLVWLASLIATSTVTLTTVGALVAVGLAFVLPVSGWWRAMFRRPDQSPTRMLAESLGGGAFVAVTLWLTYGLIDWQVTLVGYDRLASPLFPPDVALLTAHTGRLLLAIASLWTVSSVLAALAERWRLSWRKPLASSLAGALWVLPTALALIPNRWSPLPTAAIIAVACVAAGFALTAARVRRFFRHASQSTRLLCLFGAAALPALVWYPAGTFSADRAIEHLIEHTYAPATVNHPQQLQAELEQATRDIDQLPNLATILSGPATDGGAVSTDAAFLVWSQTDLSRSRLTSALELYDASGHLTSRFALNVPEYGIDQSSAETRCQWDTYGEVGTFGGGVVEGVDAHIERQEQRMLHSERSLCDSEGRSLGSIVIHVMFDYRALPFISAINPYDDLLRSAGQPQAARPRGIQTVVYGWGRVPTFTSGQTAWPLDLPLISQIERSREPFWTTRRTEAGAFRVYFANDRSGIYALGYPIPGVFDYLTRLAETTAVAALVFGALLAVTAIIGPITRRPTSPLHALAVEIRTSFYRKLFLSFVFTAVVPVLVLAFTFSAYMSDKLRTDVESEALSSATIARRVLEDTIAVQQVPPTDDVLVWIGQVINQDVNLYDGPVLKATSQRDLFDSGLLPERTPSTAFRAIAFDRLPSFVSEDRAGAFTYLLATAPVPALGRQALLSVPLTLRQQEIEREITELNRGVLLGAVLVILLAAFLGASVAQRVSDPVERLTRATQQIAAGRLDVRIEADTADELRRLVTDFNSMAATLREQRAELGRTHELKAWADMSRQVAHDIKNPLTPIQLAAEHLRRVHEDQRRPLGTVFDQCVDTVLGQVRLLRQIANEFSHFATAPVPRLVRIPLAPVLEGVVHPYRAGLAAHTQLTVDSAPGTPDARADRTLLSRALTNLIENALQATPSGGTVRLTARAEGTAHVQIECVDQGMGMSADAVARAFEPHFSTKTGGSGLGLANAKRNIESCGGTISLESALGHGTTVLVRLPVAGPDDAHATE